MYYILNNYKREDVTTLVLLPFHNTIVTQRCACLSVKLCQETSALSMDYLMVNSLYHHGCCAATSCLMVCYHVLIVILATKVIEKTNHKWHFRFIGVWPFFQLNVGHIGPMAHLVWFHIATFATDMYTCSCIYMARNNLLLLLLLLPLLFNLLIWGFNQWLLVKLL